MKVLRELVELDEEPGELREPLVEVRGQLQLDPLPGRRVHAGERVERPPGALEMPLLDPTDDVRLVVLDGVFRLSVAESVGPGREQAKGERHGSPGGGAHRPARSA